MSSTILDCHMCEMFTPHLFSNPHFIMIVTKGLKFKFAASAGQFSNASILRKSAN